MLCCLHFKIARLYHTGTANGRHAGGRVDACVRGDFVAVFTVGKAGRKPALRIGFSVMAGRGNCWAAAGKFEPAVRHQAVSLRHRWDDDDVYRRLRDQARSGDAVWTCVRRYAEMS